MFSLILNKFQSQLAYCKPTCVHDSCYAPGTCACNLQNNGLTCVKGAILWFT